MLFLISKMQVNLTIPAKSLIPFDTKSFTDTVAQRILENVLANGYAKVFTRRQELYKGELSSVVELR